MRGYFSNIFCMSTNLSSFVTCSRYSRRETNGDYVVGTNANVNNILKMLVSGAPVQALASSNSNQNLILTWTAQMLYLLHEIMTEYSMRMLTCMLSKRNKRA